MTTPTDMRRLKILALLCLAVVLSFSTWFSANAVAPVLTADWGLTAAEAGWLTNAVQIGFVLGALAASLFNLPDLVRMNRLMAASALVAAASNAALLADPGPAAAIACRIVTGVALAGVYPPALKLVSTWFVTGRGLALAAVIAALTAGSSLPHLVHALTSVMASAPDWKAVILASSLASLISALLFLLFAADGPHPFGRALFAPRQIGAVLNDRTLMLVNLGYFGHMWELYAMWAWLLTWLDAASEAGTAAIGNPSALAFSAIVAGVAGCFLGGILSDRIGRTATTALFMIVSGACAIAIGFAFDGPAWLLFAIAIVWGIAIIGDSAQFSAAVTELADRNYVGTALSLQMGLGFALTIAIIWFLPHLAEFLGGWRWVFAALAIGPAFGAAAMLVLRRRPEASRLAGGRR